MRIYKSGTTWALWRWSEIDAGYIQRLHIVKTPWFAVCLHKIVNPDPEPFLHDHPVTFLAIILRGMYREMRQKPGRQWPTLVTRRWYNFITASPDDRHKIVCVPAPTWTLALMGPKVREWGFHTDKGWVYWKDFNAKYKGEKDGLSPHQ